MIPRNDAEAKKQLEEILSAGMNTEANRKRLSAALAKLEQTEQEIGRIAAFQMQAAKRHTQRLEEATT